MLGWRHLTPGFVGRGIFRVKRPSLHVSQNSVKPEVFLNPPAVMIPHKPSPVQGLYGLNSQAEQIRKGRKGREGRAEQGRAGQLWLAGGEAEPLTAQMGLYSTIHHRLHPLFGPCWASSVLEQVGI